MIGSYTQILVKLLLVEILFLWFGQMVYGQNPQPTFRHYSLREGLISTDINNIVQDKNGYIWTCHSTGISRFNGYEFENFTEILSDSSEVLTFKHLAIDNRGVLWIGTERSGVITYDPEKNQVKRYTHNPNDPSTINAHFVNHIFIDSEEEVWVCTWYGLNRYDPTTDAFMSYKFGTSESTEIFNYNVIEDIEELPDGTFWIGTWGGGLHHFDPDSGKFEHFEHYDPAVAENLWVHDILTYGENSLFLATVGNGLLRFDLTDKSFERLDFYPAGNHIGFKRVLSLFLRSQDELWVGTEEGLVIYNLVTKSGRLIHDRGSKGSSLQHKNVSSVFRDNHGGIWIDAGGLSYYNPGAYKFELLTASDNQPSISDNEIYSFLEIGQGQIWISSKEGINQWNQSDHTSKHLDLFPGIAHILKKHDDRVFAAVQRGGLHIHNIHTRKITSYNKHQDLSRGLLNDHILSMDVDTEGNLWIGSGEGLTLLRKSDNRFVHFIGNKGASGGLPEKSVSGVTVDAAGAIWMINHRTLVQLEYIDPSLLEAGGPSGIIRNENLFTIKTIESFPIVRALQSHGDAIFIGVMNKCSVYDIKTLARTDYTIKSNQSGPNFKAICPDGRQGIWISTDNGILYINLRTSEMTTFFEEDGLQGNFFQQNAVLRDSRGKIYFGGNHGFNIIDPDKIELNPYIPPVTISNVLVFNEPVKVRHPFRKKEEGFRLDLKSNYLKELKLNYDQNAITFEFASMNFLYPEKNQYAYMIEGVDKDWNYIGNRRYATYTNLPENQVLTLKVKATNNDGVWNPLPTQLKIFITPPFWSTPAFRAGVLSLLAMVGIALYRLRIRSLKQQKRKLEKEVTLRTSESELQKKEIQKQNELLRRQSTQLKELDRAKNRFYTNISHEFRTPLSLILGPADELLKNRKLSIKEKEYLEIISQNAGRMLRLVTQVLDLSKLKEGVLRLEASKGNIVNIIEEITDSFRFKADQQKIELRLMKPQTVSEGYFDKDKVEKVLYNLISNSFKYTKAGDTITIKAVYIEKERQIDSLVLTVSDTGLGIPEKDLEFIFDPYFRGDNRHTQQQFGAGIGLSLVKSLIDLHHGKIEVKSSENKGTDFIITLPLHISHYAAEEILDHIIQQPEQYFSTLTKETKLDDLYSVSIPKPGSKKILLVEDNQELLQFMVNSLSDHYQLLTAKDGMEAIDVMENSSPDLIISDVMMPRLNGFHLCKALKSDQRWNHIPLILLTARTSHEAAMEGLSKGADIYLPKPINMDFLKVHINNALRAYDNIRQKYETILVTDLDHMQPADADREFLESVLAVLEKNITHKDINIDLFVRELGKSRTLLYQNIKKATGDSMGVFIRKNRLNYAAKLLLENNYNTSELAYKVGFSDPKYFSRCFRRQFGKSPKDFLQSRIKN